MSRLGGWVLSVLSVVVLTASLVWAAYQVTEKDLREGKQLYDQACASCHGDDGKGVTTGLGVKTPLPDLAWCVFNSEEPDQDWALVIAKGGPAIGRSIDMPSFGDSLTEEQIRQVIAYTRTFCPERWPRGELNFPRPLVTGKAWPENEVVLSWAFGRKPDTEKNGLFSLTFEKRVGPRGQVEVTLPFELLDPPGAGALGGIGDVEVGAKYVLYDSLKTLTIVSGGVDIGFPSGAMRRGTGKGTATVAPFLAAGKAWGDFVLQASLKLEQPLVERRAPKELLYNVAFMHPLSSFERQGGAIMTAQLELNGKTEWGLDDAKDFQLFITPGLRKGLTRSGVWAAAIGVQFPVTGVKDFEYRIMGYLLWEYPPWRWFDR